jgi:hypothetical protein
MKNQKYYKKRLRPVLNFGTSACRKNRRFYLRGVGAEVIAAHMKRWLMGLIFGMMMAAGCQDKKELTVTEFRPATSRDQSPKLAATSDERFRDAKPSPVKGETPAGWLVQPPSQFRLLNYRFGETGMGEVWVSLSAGSVLDNTNRWLKQFGTAPLDPVGLENLRSVTIAGAGGKWVEASGVYSSGMGAAPKPGFALAGIVAAAKGQILTLKMVGPKAEVESAKADLEKFSQSLLMVE